MITHLSKAWSDIPRFPDPLAVGSHWVGEPGLVWDCTLLRQGPHLTSHSRWVGNQTIHCLVWFPDPLAVGSQSQMGTLGIHCCTSLYDQYREPMQWTPDKTTSWATTRPGIVRKAFTQIFQWTQWLHWSLHIKTQFTTNKQERLLSCHYHCL